MDMDMDSAMAIGVSEPEPVVAFLENYFSHPEHRGVLLAHIGLMILAWLVVLPLGKLPRSQAQKPYCTGCLG